LIWTFTVALLFPGTGSTVDAPDATLAESEIVAFFAVAATVIDTGAAAPLARLPRLHVTVPVEPTGGVVQVPLLVVMLENALPPGKTFVSVAAAEFGPKFVTVIVKVTGFLYCTGDGDPEMATARSAVPMIVAV
jgi:hypothetical protein